MALRSDISVAIASVVVVLVIVAAGLVEAQTPTPNCAAKLTACGQFLKSDNPPPSCCDSIKEAVATQLDCLCTLYSSGMLSSISVNVTDALHLTKACGVPNDLSKCSNTSVPAPKQGSSSTPAGNDAEKLAFTGFASLLLFSASLIVY